MRTENELGLDGALFDMLAGLDDMLEKLGVECAIHRGGDEALSDYDEDDACIIAINPHTDRNVEIYFSYYSDSDFSKFELTLCFADWHAHFSQSKFSDLSEMLRGFLTNEEGVASVFLGTELRWNGSSNVSRSDVETKPPDEAFAGTRIMAQVYKERWEKNGAEVRFLFWDPKYDKIYTIEKR